MPIVAVCFVGVVVWQYFQVPFINDLSDPRQRATVREHWVQSRNIPGRAELDQHGQPGRAAAPAASKSSLFSAAPRKNERGEAFIETALTRTGRAG